MNFKRAEYSKDSNGAEIIELVFEDYDYSSPDPREGHIERTVMLDVEEWCQMRDTIDNLANTRPRDRWQG